MKKSILILLLWSLFGQVKAQIPVNDNLPAKNTSLLPLPNGPSVLGVFDGRTPCQELAKQFHQETTPDCIKIKWRLILYQDPKTQTPTSYELEGFVYKNPSRKGKWTIVKGTTKNPNAIVYKLDFDKPNQSIALLKGDDNVLFFLDKEMKLMVGNENFSYTLNRTGQ